MSTCLKAAPAADAAKPMTPQQEKMKTCNATAATQALTGDARKNLHERLSEEKNKDQKDRSLRQLLQGTRSYVGAAAGCDLFRSDAA